MDRIGKIISARQNDENKHVVKCAACPTKFESGRGVGSKTVRDKVTGEMILLQWCSTGCYSRGEKRDLVARGVMRA